MASGVKAVFASLADIEEKLVCRSIDKNERPMEWNLRKEFC